MSTPVGLSHTRQRRRLLLIGWFICVAIVITVAINYNMIAMYVTNFEAFEANEGKQWPVKDAVESNGAPIPKIIHQSWKTHDIPNDIFSNWHLSWKTNHPRYHYRLWNDTENEVFIRDFYPWFLQVYQSYPREINRADAVRVFYMHHFGGIYADLDVLSLRPIDPLLLEGHDAILGKMDTAGSESWEYPHGVPNAFMASKPGHAFWMHCAHRMMLAAEKETGTEELTGPVVIWRALQSYLEMDVSAVHKIHLAEPGIIFPYSWSFVKTDDSTHAICSIRRPTFNQQECIHLVDPDSNAYTITFWSHTWD